MKGQIVMSGKELDRIKILNEVSKGNISKTEAAELLNISCRHIYRLIERYQLEGDIGLIHKLRGKKSNRGYGSAVKKQAISLYRSRYSDYGPTLFSEKLLEYHNLRINRETLRLWLRQQAITTGLRKKRSHRKRRERRTGFGELLQFDGSTHDWFEGRGPECCLLHAVDDATSRVYLKFARSENTQDAMQTMWEYVNLHGVPRQLYTDKGSVFYAETQLTDFTRAMEELGCQAIFAHSPQAKGRVERGNKTFQDRLIKAMRERGISSIGEANKYLCEEFIAAHNAKFSVSQDFPDVHYSVADKDLTNIFCYKTQRQVRNDYTLTLRGTYLQITHGDAPIPMPQKMVGVHRWLDGSLHLFYNENELTFQQLRSKPKGKGRCPEKPKSDHPWRVKNLKLTAKKNGQVQRVRFDTIKQSKSTQVLMR